MATATSACRQRPCRTSICPRRATRGPIIVHEGVPGHYLQLALSWAHENPIRRRYYDSGANEGIGFYAEEMMLQAGLWADSPRSREIIYNFARLRALRVEVDVRLATGEFTIAQAADYLEKTVPMDRETALEEAASFAAGPGQAITYQTGKLQIIRMLADARRQQGERFSLRAFHDFVWKNGNVPLSLQRWELLDDRSEVDRLAQLRLSCFFGPAPHYAPLAPASLARTLARSAPRTSHSPMMLRSPTHRRTLRTSASRRWTPPSRCSTTRPPCPSSPATARKPPAASTTPSCARSRSGSSYLRELEERRATILKSIERTGQADAGARGADSRRRHQGAARGSLPALQAEAPHEGADRARGGTRAAGAGAAGRIRRSVPEQRRPRRTSNADKGVADVAAALEGARWILVEQFAEDAELVGGLRQLLWDTRRVEVHGRARQGGRRARSSPTTSTPPSW